MVGHKVIGGKLVGGVHIPQGLFLVTVIPANGLPRTAIQQDAYESRRDRGRREREKTD